jgi:hypothetical protein
MREYTRRIFKRAVQNAAGSFGGMLRGIVASALGLTLQWLLGLVAAGRGPRFWASLIGGQLITALLVLMWHLWRAAFQDRSEADKQIAKLPLRSRLVFSQALLPVAQELLAEVARHDPAFPARYSLYCSFLAHGPVLAVTQLAGVLDCQQAYGPIKTHCDELRGIIQSLEADVAKD